MKTQCLHHLHIFVAPALLISACLLLAGCATAPPAPVRVEVPVMVPCISEVPQRPAYEFDRLPVTATDGEIILALARDWARGQEYEQWLAV